MRICLRADYAGLFAVCLFWLWNCGCGFVMCGCCFWGWYKTETVGFWCFSEFALLIGGYGLLVACVESFMLVVCMFVLFGCLLLLLFA